MQIKEIRIWLNINIDRDHHNTMVEKLLPEPIGPQEVTDELILDLIREAKNYDITDKTLEIRHMISHEVKYKGHDEPLLETRYNVALDPEKMSEEEKARFLLLIYGIKTKKAKASDMSWEPVTEEFPPLDPLEYGFPEKMLVYLEKEENLFKRITGAGDAPTMIELRSAKTLTLIDIEFYPSDEHTRISDENVFADPNYDPDDDSDKRYKTKAIDLIKGNDLYSSEGLLIWIPELKVFGAFDEEHGNLMVFPDAKPADIQKNLGAYLQAEWSYSKDYIVKCGNVYDYFEPWKHFAFE